MKKLLCAAMSGILFAAGLVLSGMTQPAKVIAFLDVTSMTRGISWSAQSGFWDPSLAFVMGGALMVTLIAFAVQPKRGKPWFAEGFELPTRKDIDGPLVAGAALFGAGWGLAGYCPGPALASVALGADALIFTAAMLLGMAATKKLSRRGVLSRGQD